jgi:hypothetical protein
MFDVTRVERRDFYVNGVLLDICESDSAGAVTTGDHRHALREHA